MLKLNLGSEGNVLDGWENFDPRWEKFPGVKYWEWNKPIPCGDGEAEIALVQHVLMYCDKAHYDWNLKEINRVLCKGGVFLLKEEDDTIYQWRKLGTKHKTGDIIGSTNPQDIVQYLERAGFVDLNFDKQDIVNRYGNIINRQHKLFRNRLFVVECKKA